MELYTETFELTAVFRLIVASLCGAMIGLERELKGRPAGLKTFSLVCVGATLAMITNEYISRYLSGGSGDAARMAAQVISGIGFLGAGTIMVTGGNQVKGLTTAAALWVTASVGIAIGAGFYFGGIAGVCIILGSSFLCRIVDRRLTERSRFVKLWAEGSNEDFMLHLTRLLSVRQIRIKNMVRRSESKWYKKDICVILELDLGKRSSHRELLEEIRKIDGIRFAEEI